MERNRLFRFVFAVIIIVVILVIVLKLFVNYRDDAKMSCITSVYAQISSKNRNELKSFSFIDKNGSKCLAKQLKNQLFEKLEYKQSDLDCDVMTLSEVKDNTDLCLSDDGVFINLLVHNPRKSTTRLITR